jgi:hypothetical protein
MMGNERFGTDETARQIELSQRSKIRRDGLAGVVDDVHGQSRPEDVEVVGLDGGVQARLERFVVCRRQPGAVAVVETLVPRHGRNLGAGTRKEGQDGRGPNGPICGTE